MFPTITLEEKTKNGYGVVRKPWAEGKRELMTCPYRRLFRSGRLQVPYNRGNYRSESPKSDRLAERLSRVSKSKSQVLANGKLVQNRVVLGWQLGK